MLHQLQKFILETHDNTRNIRYNERRMSSIDIDTVKSLAGVSKMAELAGFHDYQTWSQIIIDA
jgi:hypothetical protein